MRKAQAIEPELKARGLAFLTDTLSKVEGFPTAQLGECEVRVDLERGVLVVNVPTYKMGVGENLVDDHKLKLELKQRLSSMLGVADVEVVGSMNSGIMSLDVTLQSGQVPAQSSSPEIEELDQKARRESFVRVMQQLP